MGGGTLQLVIHGGQDIYLTGNPETSFFKSVYRRYTNFSIESIEQILSGDITSKDFTVNSKITKSGDLLHKMYFEIDLPEQNLENSVQYRYCHYSNTTALCFLKDVSIFIGDKLIDKHDGRYYDILNELKRYDDRGIDYIINRSRINKETVFKPNNVKLFIPLNFWFCKDISQSLPLIALQFHDVKLKASFRSIKHIINSEEAPPIIDEFGDLRPQDDTITVSGNDIHNLVKPKVKLWSNYINLDVDERKRFAQKHHEYLIEQVQLVERDFKPSIDINLNHPVKILYWVIQNNTAIQGIDNYKLIDNLKNDYGDPNELPLHNLWKNGNDFLNYKIHEPVNPSHLGGVTIYEHFEKMKITFNGIDRFKEREPTYFRALQPLENKYTIPEKNIYMYSFCLDPENHQPTGSCNFSRIDNLSFTFKGNHSYNNYKIFIYARNYNVLRIMEGMGGLLYSN